MFREGERIELPDLAVGLELPTSKFTVRKVLRGGMGECAKIVHDSSGRAFALKIVNDVALRHSEAFERFCQEVKIWTSASTYLKIERRTLLQWVRQGKVRGYILSGTQRHVWRFKTSDLDAMLSVPAVLSIDGRI